MCSRVFTVSVSPTVKRTFNLPFFLVVKAMSSLSLEAESGAAKWDWDWGNGFWNWQCTGDNWSHGIRWDNPEKCSLERK